MPPRYAKKVDSNQAEIVKQLRSMPGVEVEVDHHDIFVGRCGKNYWFEIKDPGEVGRNGKVRESALKPSQKRLKETWPGHYSIVWSLDQILEEIGITLCSFAE